MPWHISTNHPGCSGYAVVKDEDNELEGCHRTRAQAERQLAALNIAEYGDDSEDRARREVERIIVTDIDDTIIRDGRTPIRSVIDEINSYGLDVYVVSGRSPDRRDETAAVLDAAGLIYDDLYLMGSPEAKVEKVAELLTEYAIEIAYENNPDTRRAYERLGIKTSPGQTRRAQVEEILAELRAKRYA